MSKAIIQIKFVEESDPPSMVMVFLSDKETRLFRCIYLFIYLFFLMSRYLGSKAVKLFKVRMHGSDAVSSLFLVIYFRDSKLTSYSVVLTVGLKP